MLLFQNRQYLMCQYFLKETRIGFQYPGVNNKFTTKETKFKDKNSAQSGSIRYAR